MRFVFRILALNIALFSCAVDIPFVTVDPFCVL